MHTPMNNIFRRMTDEQATQMLHAMVRAAECAGGWPALARAVGGYTGTRVSPQAVFRWSVLGVPAERAVDIECALDGQVLRQELRPDLYAGMRKKTAA